MSEWLKVWIKSMYRILYETDKVAYYDKMNAFNNADELLKASREYIAEEKNHERKKKDFVEFARGVVDFKVGENGYQADIIVAIKNDRSALLYDVVRIQHKEIVADATNTVYDRRPLHQLPYNNISQEEGDVNKNSNNFIEPNNGIRYSLPSRETREFLEKQDTITVYRAMQIIDGKLYPPMAAKVKSEDGSRQLVMASELGRWEQADERPDLIRKGNKFVLDKANGSSIEAAYNPYFHTSRSPLNDQFSSAYKRGNLVIVEGEVPAAAVTVTVILVRRKKKRERANKYTIM